jgi:periplasmic protein TonB
MQKPMTEKNAKSKSTIVILGLLLIGLVSVYAFFKWKNNSPYEQTVHTETGTIADSLQDTLAKADTAKHTMAKEKRVVMDILDPVDPEYPIPPIDPIWPIDPGVPIEPDPVGIEYHAETINHDSALKKVFDVVEEMPTYIDGEKAFYEFAAKNIVYPAKDKEEGKEGNVYLSVIVELDGTLSDITVKKAYSQAAGIEAVRVAKLTKWNPGKMWGKPVRVKMFLPFKFRL